MTLVQAYNEFMLDKKAQGITDKSLVSYKDILHIFIDYIGENIPIESIGINDMRKYAIMLRNKKLSQATQATYMRNVKIFMRWIQDEYGLAFDAKKIRVPKSPKKKVKIYDNGDIEHIFSGIKSKVEWIEIRNKAMVALMLDSGLRQCELCRLKRADINQKEKYIIVYGKGNKERYVPIGEFALNILNAYYAICPYDGGCVFYNLDGSPLSGNAVRLFTHRLQRELGFKFTSHALRHNFATHYIMDNLEERNTSGVYDLSIIMGHESIETTKSYEHLAHEIIAVKSSNSHLDKVFALSGA